MGKLKKYKSDNSHFSPTQENKLNHTYLLREARHFEHPQKTVEYILSTVGRQWTGSGKQLFLISLWLLLENIQATQLKLIEAGDTTPVTYGNRKERRLANRNRSSVTRDSLAFSSIFQPQQCAIEKKSPTISHEQKPSHHILTTQEKLELFITSIPYHFDKSLTKDEQTSKKLLVQNSLIGLAQEPQFQYIFELLKLSKDFSIFITENNYYPFMFDAIKNQLVIHTAFLTSPTKESSQSRKMYLLHELAGHGVIRNSNILNFGVEGVAKTKIWASALDLPIKKSSHIKEEVFEHLSELLEIYGNAKKIIFSELYPLHKKYKNGIKLSENEKLLFDKYADALKHYEPWIFYNSCSENDFYDEPKKLKDKQGYHDHIHHLNSYQPLTYYTHGFYKMNDNYAAMVSTVENPFDTSINVKIEAFIKDMIFRNEKDNQDLDDFIKKIYPPKKEYSDIEINFAKKFKISMEFVSDTESLHPKIKDLFFKGYKEYFKERFDKINTLIKENDKEEIIYLDDSKQEKNRSFKK